MGAVTALSGVERCRWPAVRDRLRPVKTETKGNTHSKTGSFGKAVRSVRVLFGVYVWSLGLDMHDLDPVGERRLGGEVRGRRYAASPGG